MTPIALALALFLADQPAAAPAPEAPAAEAVLDHPTGAPRDDYQFVAWCYGALRGYLDLHDEVMPEVTRIEGEFRKPGTRLEDDLKVYADMQKAGRQQLKTFQSALTAAEKASIRPINVIGAQALQQGRATWTADASVTKARKAQEWMSWVLPARCDSVAANLEAKSKLMGATLRANQPKEEPAAAPPAEAPADPAPAETPKPAN